MREVDPRTYWILNKRLARRAVTGVAFTVFIGLLILVSTRERWLTALGQFLVVGADPKTADAIVIVSQGLDNRAIFASELYADGYAPVVITLGGVTPQSGAYATGARRDAEILKNSGVPTTQIIEIDDTGNLYEEATRSRDILLEQNAQTVLVVAAQVRMRRVAIVFGPIYADAGLEFLPVPDPSAGFNPAGWWTRESDALKVGIEYLKMLLGFIWR